jgi:mannose-6-phosphate isomerase-like protein (cupin superfamily)
MSIVTKFGNHPFPPDQKRPVHIRGDLVLHFIYPLDEPLFSDLNYMYASTDKLQFCTFQLGPGGVFEPPDLHAGDEVYYVLDGIITVENPVLGQCVRVKKGEALLLPKNAWHKGYNFEQEIARILAVIAPRAWKDDLPPADFDESQWKRYKGEYNNRLPQYPPVPHWDTMGTVDDIGRWPVSGPDSRQDPLHYYHISDEKKLLIVRGKQHPMLMKFVVSNDLVHVGEFVLPAGGVSVRVSEPDCHRGDCVVFVEQGPITFFLPDTSETFDVQEEEAMFIPEGVRYQLVNYTAGIVKALFAIAPRL